MRTDKCSGEKFMIGLNIYLIIYIYLVTVKAGPSHSRDYEIFVSNSLKDKILKEITSNLDKDLKEEALGSFIESVKQGYTIKDCIFKIQNDVLPKVPKERNKFFIKFTYDNQLQVGIYLSFIVVLVWVLSD